MSQIPGQPWMPDSMFSTGSDTPGPGAVFDRSGHPLCWTREDRGLLALAEAGAGVSILRIH